MPLDLSRPKPPILLELDLSQPLVEQKPEDPIAKLRSRGKPRLRPVLRALYEAGQDPRVVGLIAKVGDRTMTLARAQELRAAVAAFADSGKPTVAWADTFGESANASVPYFLASGFESVWLQSTGELNLLGTAAEVGFLRGALDKLGVEPEWGQRYEYKNFGDRIVQSDFTPAHREALGRLAESAWEQIVGAVAKSRGLDVESVQAAADRSPLFADEAKEIGLVDEIGYRDEVYAAVRRKVGAEAQLLYAERWTPQLPVVKRVRTRLSDRNRPGVALVDGHGGIVVGRSRRSPVMGQLMGSDTITAAIRAATDDDKVRAIVFRVDSPGGSAVASDSIWRAVRCARDAGKPVVVSMGSVAGSGGYYVSCCADVIVAQPATLTGSIGVVGGKFVTTELTDRLGLNYAGLGEGKHARMYSTHRKFDEDERRRLDDMLDRVYTDFTGKVAESRGMSIEAVHEVARGRVWTGADAADRGLVDQLGGLRLAVEIARERGGLPADAPLRPAVSVPLAARLKSPRSSEDPRAAASVWTDPWSGFSAMAAELGLPALGPVTMPGVRLT